MLKLLKGLLLLVFLSLALYFSLPKPWIEWDQENKKIHGTKIIFDKEMSYVALSKEHGSYGFTDDEISYGKILTVKNSPRQNSILNVAGASTHIPTGVSFIIKKSYVRKYNWLSDGFKNDFRYAVVEDEFGNMAILSFNDMEYSSSPEFAELKWSYGEI